MNSRSPYAETMELNVQGILLLQEKRNLEAIAYFNRGLHVIQAFLSRNEESGIQRGAQEIITCATSLDCLRHGVPHERKRRLLFSVGVFEKARDIVPNEYFSLYDRALHLSAQALTNSIPTYVSGCLTIAILMYNIGLAYHLEALQKGDPHLLSTAVDSYAFAEAAIETDKTTVLNGNLGSLAIANNVGHIHAYCRNVEGTKVCGVELCRQLFALLRLDIVSDEDEEYITLLLNMTCFLTDREVLCAPAA